VPANGPGFSRVARDPMMAQLGRHERSGPRRLQPRVSRASRQRMRPDVTLSSAVGLRGSIRSEFVPSVHHAPLPDHHAIREEISEEHHEIVDDGVRCVRTRKIQRIEMPVRQLAYIDGYLVTVIVDLENANIGVRRVCCRDNVWRLGVIELYVGKAAPQRVDDFVPDVHRRLTFRALSGIRQKKTAVSELRF
jgi:hypothetical protein